MRDRMFFLHPSSRFCTQLCNANMRTKLGKQGKAPRLEGEEIEMKNQCIFRHFSRQLEECFFYLFKTRLIHCPFRLKLRTTRLLRNKSFKEQKFKDARKIASVFLNSWDAVFASASFFEKLFLPCDFHEIGWQIFHCLPCAFPFFAQNKIHSSN